MKSRDIPSSAPRPISKAYRARFEMAMSLAILMVLVGVGIATVGHYRGKIDALQKNPVTRVRIVPRSLYDDVMGVNWISET